MIPKKGKPILREEMTWTDIDKFTKSMNMAIIPTAASAAQKLLRIPSYKLSCQVIVTTVIGMWASKIPFQIVS